MSVESEYGRAANISTEFPFGVLSNADGWRIYEIVRTERTAAICLLRHDTSRPDPTLVADVLAENLNSELEYGMQISAFQAAFKTLADAIHAITEFDIRHGWERQHIKDMKAALFTAKRNLHAAEQSLQLSTKIKLDCFGGLSQSDIINSVYKGSEQ